MKTELIYLPPAREDVREILKYRLSRVGVKSARELYRTLTDGIAQLKAFPLSGQVVPESRLAAEGYRKLVLNQTYVAVYKVIGGTVYVYRVVNGRTDYPRLLK